MFIGTKLGIYASVGEVSGFTNTYALSYDGVDETVKIDSQTYLQWNSTGTPIPYTFAIWFKGSSSSGDAQFARCNDVGANRYYIHYMNSSGTILHQFARGSLWAKLTIDQGGWNDGNWHHLVMAYSGVGPHKDTVSGGTTFYVDGSEEAHTVTGNLTTACDPSAEEQISYSQNGNAFLSDEAAIWDVELDADAVAAIYNSGTPTDLSVDSGNYDNSGDLQGWWRNGDGATFPEIPDASTNSNAATMTNMASGDIQTDVPS